MVPIGYPYRVLFYDIDLGSGYYLVVARFGSWVIQITQNLG